MTYTLKDVDAAERLVREIRPDAVVSRGDYDFSLSIAIPNDGAGVILFRPEIRDEEGELLQCEIISSADEIRNICFLIGSQWTINDLAKITARRNAMH